jgi:hypothetical protein
VLYDSNNYSLGSSYFILPGKHFTVTGVAENFGLLPVILYSFEAGYLIHLINDTTEATFMKLNIFINASNSQVGRYLVYATSNGNNAYLRFEFVNLFELFYFFFFFFVFF